MHADDVAYGRQATHEGFVSRLTKRSMAVMCWLWALFMPFTFFVGEVYMAWWAHILLVVFLMLILLPAGYGLWSDVGDAEDITQLRRSGRPAVAEVISMHRTPGRGYGELDSVSLLLRISGDEVPVFTASYRGDQTAAFRVGTLLDAVVDPSDNLYTLIFDGDRPKRSPPTA
ncbi:hypothetical protein CLV63_14320 [Murinocardiopsis flavida]|uniref:Uncharacterized protein n=1 Tax=Murinocardiopsis flavida TaxID=645275 RepID=A0A2P8CB89_9ACTN|nr:hypothetical protein [Murinocardiopsis flavida]PSK82250.1 hypothetical protein CLV63_14320 [Murinocardiopsis flavida]